MGDFKNYFSEYLKDQITRSQIEEFNKIFQSLIKEGKERDVLNAELYLNCLKLNIITTITIIDEYELWLRNKTPDNKIFPGSRLNWDL